MSHHELTQVGKYQILDLVGEGAMGVVYRAHDPILNRIVAIKVMSDAVARNEELRNRFLREAQAAGSLQHPNVITIYDFGEVDGHLFIAMEFIEGSDLEQILARRTPLSVAQKLDIAIDVLSGLNFAHKRGLVHRDVKPANIRVTEDGRGKIMDFGIVHDASSRMTRTGVALGTPDYMAPEQVVGDRVTPSTDIFAMGSVIYELFTGARPFHADTLHAVMYKIVSEEPPRIDQVLPGLPAELSPIVARAMRKDARERYASAIEMADALSAVRASLTGAPPTTRTLSLRSTIDSSLARNSKPAPSTQRTRVAVRVLAAAGILALGGGAWWWTSHRTGPTPAAPIQSAAAPPAAPAVSQSGQSDGAAAPPPQPSITPPVASGRESADAARPPARAPDDEVVRSLRAATAQVRQRAVAAGVPAARLAEGDARLRRAEAQLRDGRAAQASSLMSQAAALWSSAERAWLDERETRPRTVAAAPSPAQSAPTTAAPAVASSQASPAPVEPAPIVPPVRAPSAASTQESAAAAEAAIASTVAAYARAIESRDLGAVRRANPGLTAVQQSGFEQFFRAVRSLRASFTVVSTEVSGATAEARLSGAYDFVTGSGQSVHQPVSFQASLRREGAAWRLVQVR